MSKRRGGVMVLPKFMAELFDRFTAGLTRDEKNGVCSLIMYMEMSTMRISICPTSLCPAILIPVSYTHLDVYKRQILISASTYN